MDWIAVSFICSWTVICILIGVSIGSTLTYRRQAYLPPTKWAEPPPDDAEPDHDESESEPQQYDGGL